MWRRALVLIPKLLIDGTVSWGILMCRKAGIRYEYRRLTDAEMAEFQSDDAW